MIKDKSTFVQYNEEVVYGMNIHQKMGGGGNFDEALHMTQQEWSNLSSFKLSKITYRNNLAKISFSAIKRHLSCCFLVLVKNQIC